VARGARMTRSTFGSEYFKYSPTLSLHGGRLYRPLASYTEIRVCQGEEQGACEAITDAEEVFAGFAQGAARW
jgi:hypothetical protein